jgi:myo-inositol 2-dehydrogenase/D-chiro-inositol 1-dehydrogenase
MNRPVSRRRVLAAAAATPLAAADSVVRVGVIGTGGRGTHDAGLLIRHTGARVVALCDIDESRIERFKKQVSVDSPRVYRDYQALLASDVDAVIIATPVFLHPEHFEAAVQAGKHIYIEKPAATDVAGCRRVMRAADAADRRLNIAFGFQQRYGPGYRKAKHLIDSGEVGSIRLAISYWIKSGVTGKEPPVQPAATREEKMRRWFDFRETFGDFIVETYCHGIDVLNWFLGGHAGKAHGAGGRTLLRRSDMHDHCHVAFTYASGVQGLLTGTQLAPRFHRDVREQFLCDNGVVETARHYWTHYRGRDDAVTEKEPRDITADALVEFIRRIREGDPENTGVRTAESTLTAIMGRMAIDLKREVTWDEVLRS